MFGVGREDAAFALDVGGDTLPSSPPRDDARAVGGGRQDGAAMHRDAPRLGIRLGEHDRLLAEHEDGGAAEKMRGNDRAARGHSARAVDDGDGVAAGVAHLKRCSSRTLR